MVSEDSQSALLGKLLQVDKLVTSWRHHFRLIKKHCIIVLCNRWKRWICRIISCCLCQRPGAVWSAYLSYSEFFHGMWELNLINAFLDWRILFSIFQYFKLHWNLVKQEFNFLVYLKYLGIMGPFVGNHHKVTLIIQSSEL